MRAAAPPRPLAGARVASTRRRPVRVSAGDDDPTPPPSTPLDDLLDFMQAGRKMRRWYGADETYGRMNDGGGDDLPRDGSGPTPRQGPTPPRPQSDRDTIVVAGVDGPVGEAALTDLVVRGGGGARGARLVALTSSPAAVAASFGDYATPLARGDDDRLTDELARASAVVVAGSGARAVAEAAAAAAVPHLVLLTADPPSNPFAAIAGFFGDAGAAEAAAAAGASRADGVAAALSRGGATGATIVRAGRGVRDAPGGRASVAVSASGSSVGSRPVAAGDAGAALAAAATGPPPAPGSVSRVELTDRGDGAPPADWEAAVVAARGA
jgi:hypothetical protein